MASDDFKQTGKIRFSDINNLNVNTISIGDKTSGGGVEAYCDQEGGSVNIFPADTDKWWHIDAYDGGLRFVYQGTIIPFKISSDMKFLLNLVYPVGSVYLSVNNVSPQTFWGGEWSALPEGYALWTCSSDGGGKIPASLPNLKGTNKLGWSGVHEGACTNGADATGVFKDNPLYLYNYSTRNVGNGAHSVVNENIPIGISFDASKYNSIYSDSATTVQPPAIKVYAWQRTN